MNNQDTRIRMDLISALIDMYVNSGKKVPNEMIEEYYKLRECVV